jgi:hypothetical protein
MKPTLPLLTLVSLLTGQLGLAQTNSPADDWKPATSNQPGKQYPQVNSERRVRARLVAPQATNVTFEFLGGAKYPLTKGEDGAWVGVTRPQDEGFHYYQLVIDGAGVPDPGSLYFYGGNRWGSGVEVPAQDQDFYAVKENVFKLTTRTPGTLWLQNVSLFPPTYKDRVNGNRRDIMEWLAAMKSKFLRFPGGNYLEGNAFNQRFDWKETIGPVEQRPGHPSPWGYWSTDGLGLLEFAEWCEDLDMEPLLGVFAGYCLGRGGVIGAGPQLEPYVQEALEELGSDRLRRPFELRLALVLRPDDVQHDGRR